MHIKVHNKILIQIKLISVKINFNQVHYKV